MGEITCRKCGHVNWHVRVHITGVCDKCRTALTFCTSCLTEVKAPEQWAVNFLKRMEQEGAMVFEYGSGE